MNVHPVAARGFGNAADAYERGRPSYPAEAVAWLVERLGLRPGRTVVDLAAGTGKLTRLLVPSGARVVAIEPVEAMRARLETEVPDAEAAAGVADGMPLPDGGADAVTVAQAFHWFATGEAVAEIARVLRPGGALALVWNLRDQTDPLQERLSAIIEPFRAEESTPTAYDEARWRRPIDASPLLGPLDERRFRSEQQLDADGLAARFGSISFVADLEKERRDEILTRVRALAGTQTVRLPYVTRVLVADRR